MVDRHPTRGEADGFSLIEVLVATSLLICALAALGQIFLIATRTNIAARDATYAAILAAQKLEQLRAAPFADAAPSEAIEYLQTGGAAYVRTVRIDPLPSDSLRSAVITVTVARRHAPGVGLARFITIKTRKN